MYQRASGVFCKLCFENEDATHIAHRTTLFYLTLTMKIHLVKELMCLQYDPKCITSFHFTAHTRI